MTEVEPASRRCDRRAVGALEQIDTADARALLKTLAVGAAHARLTEAAAAALQRLERRRRLGRSAAKMMLYLVSDAS